MGPLKKKIETGGVGFLKDAGWGRPFFLIAGPCVIESERHCLGLARALKKIAAEQGVSLIFKASYDKANRTSIRSYRGPGPAKGLRVLRRVKEELGLPTLSDVHTTEQVAEAAEALDVLQIPAFLCRQTDLVVAAAATGRALNIKKGQFLAPWDAENILEKARSAGAKRVMITERGVSFGYNNLVVDFKSLPILRRLGALAVFDATHSVQLPGGAGHATGGQAEFIPFLARAAVAAGVDGIFVEVHEDPSKALSDGPNALRLDRLADLLGTLREIDAIVKAEEAREGAG